ncbi:thiamine ABC transporter ATP-binding protein [Psychromonas ossibalaenae]|uniref:thiamine ABC transporter ATP-binding protein n=1 Tax=Psychromonas ossibalaenae TaxID=444922 RepID=UPI0003672D1B|nr:thiamine ABC transporter ATP-binding protein [Psychromonas ossibalaenae]
MIKFCSVKYLYQKEQFNFDIEIDTGSIVAVLGASGAGKSTLLNLAAGFIDPLSGDIQIAGESILNVQPYHRPLAMLFQENNLFAHLNVADNIGLGLHPGLKLTLEQKAKVEEICQQVGVEKLQTRLPHQLSGGQRQRVALARCFVQNKPLLLLDEPFSALDPILREEMLAMVKKLAARHKVTVLMVTHHISDALNAASHYLFVDQGQVSSAGEISRLNCENPNPSLRRFVQAGL